MSNKPNNPALWSRAKSMAKQKFDVYPSAYANGWAAKWYKSKGGTWRKAEYGMEVPYMAKGGTNNPGFEALPSYVQAKILSNMGYGGMADPYMQKGGEPDGGMALGQIAAVVDKMSKLAQFIKPDSDLEPWISSKLAVMDHYADAVSDYMNYNPEAQGNEPEMMEQMAEGGIPERYKNMGFTKAGVKKNSTRPGKKWMVLAKKGSDYKVVHGGYDGMKDFSQHGSEKRKENFWNRMGGKNSSKATDPFSPLYWHKRFGTWAEGGEIDLPQSEESIEELRKLINSNYMIPKKKAGGSTFSGNAWYKNGGSAYMQFAQNGLQAAIPPPPMPYDYPDHGSYNAAIQEWTSLYGDPAAYDYSANMAMPDTIPAAPIVNPAAVASMPPAAAPAATLNPYDGGSIYDFMKAQGKAPDYQSRKSLANALGISGYRGSADQNMELLEMIRQNPAILMNYTGQGQNAYAVNPSQAAAPMQGSASPQAQGQTVIAPEVQQAIDTIASIAPTADTTVNAGVALPTTTTKKSSASNKSKTALFLAGLSAVASAGGLTYIEYKELMDMIKAGNLDLPPASQAKVLESLEVLRNNSLQNVGTSVQNTFNAYNSPEESVARLRGRLASNIGNRTSSALAATDWEDDAIRTFEETQAALKQRRIENARKASNARWAKVRSAQANSTAAAASASTAENTAVAAANSMDDAARAASALDAAADMVPTANLASRNAALRNFFSRSAVGTEALNATRAMVNETPWLRTVKNYAPKLLKFIKGMPKLEDGGMYELDQYQTRGQVNSNVSPSVFRDNVNKEEAQRKYEEGEANDSQPWWLELIDPTGYTSWDDARRTWNNPNSAWWEHALAGASVLPVFGKIGKAGKIFDVVSDASKLSRGQKTVNTGKKVVNATVKGLDWVTGAPIVRGIDRMNPVVHGMGYAGTKLLGQTPRILKGVEIMNDINRGLRGNRAMTDAFSSYMSGNRTPEGYVTLPAEGPRVQEQVNISDSDPVTLILPNGQRLNTTMGSPAVRSYWDQGLIDTTASGFSIDTSGGMQRPAYRIKAQRQFGGGTPCYECGGMFAYGGINLDPAKKGTFKAQATRMGMGVQEAAKAILNAPKGKYSPAMRKKANFARNFAKQEGGPVEGDVMDVTPEQLELLKAQGYQFEII